MKQTANNHRIRRNGRRFLRRPYLQICSLLAFFCNTCCLILDWSGIYLRYKLPVYQTTATLLIKDDKSSSPASELQDAFDMFGVKKNVENEVEVLQSKTLMKEVVENLHLYAPISLEGRVINQSGYIKSPVVIEAKVPDSLKQVNKVPFTYNIPEGRILIGNTSYPLNRWVNTPYGTYSVFLKSILSTF